jgi:hypothetical protein
MRLDFLHVSFQFLQQNFTYSSSIVRVLAIISLGPFNSVQLNFWSRENLHSFCAAQLGWVWESDHDLQDHTFEIQLERCPSL